MSSYLSRYHHFTIPEYSPAAVAQFLIQDPERWGKSLVFFCRQDQCDACWEILTAAGVSAEVVTAKTDREPNLPISLRAASAS